ncbi:phospholipase D-like domain-containing protein [Natronorubrum sp. A-ect3]|uniref:phospholipase D-like domain-containing protein n=1 Tax=Natronorubrum sp. A-ect3 TaxID=3242698 RepID=UPI00359E3178
MSFLRAERVVLISPWISDIDIEFPNSDRVSSDTMGLIQTINMFSDVDCTVFTNTDSYNEYFIDRLSDETETRMIEDLHAKLVVTDDLVYMGSANITWSGVSHNIESARVVENTYEDSEAFVEGELSLSI